MPSPDTLVGSATTTLLGHGPVVLVPVVVSVAGSGDDLEQQSRLIAVGEPRSTTTAPSFVVVSGRPRPFCVPSESHR